MTAEQDRLRLPRSRSRFCAAWSASSSVLYDARCRFGDGLVLIARAAADANRADHLAPVLEWNAARQDVDAPMVGFLDAVECRSRLGEAREVAGREIEGARRESLADGD